MTRVLEVENLRVSFPDSNGGRIRPVDGVTFALDRGETMALVGESGCGKSLTSLGPTPAHSASRAYRARERDPSGRFQRPCARGRGAARHSGSPDRDDLPGPDDESQSRFLLPETRSPRRSARTIRSRARRRGSDRCAMLQEVGIPDPVARLDAYPHQLSGGMRQRVMIAIALAAEPEILVADEPTTALDVTVQAQILEVLDRLRASRGMAVLLITHDLGIVAGRADRVAVMYAARSSRRRRPTALFANPSHPYTQGLFASMPRLRGPVERLNPIPGSVPPPAAWPAGCRFRPRCPKAFDKCPLEPPLLDVEDTPDAVLARGEAGMTAASLADPLLQVRDLVKHYHATGIFRSSGPPVRAVDGVSFEVGRGETLALVGESGCGKSSVGRTILRLQEPTGGHVVFEGVDLFPLGRTELRRLRRRMQIVFQDPYAASIRG